MRKNITQIHPCAKASMVFLYGDCKVARIVRIVNDIVDTEFIYTNQHLANYAEKLLDRLINQTD